MEDFELVVNILKWTLTKNWKIWHRQHHIFSERANYRLSLIRCCSEVATLQNTIVIHKFPNSPPLSHTFYSKYTFVHSISQVIKRTVDIHRSSLLKQTLKLIVKFHPGGNKLPTLMKIQHKTMNISRWRGGGVWLTRGLLLYWNPLVHHPNHFRN